LLITVEIGIGVTVIIALGALFVCSGSVAQSPTCTMARYGMRRKI